MENKHHIPKSYLGKNSVCHGIWRFYLDIVDVASAYIHSLLFVFSLFTGLYLGGKKVVVAQIQGHWKQQLSL